MGGCRLTDACCPPVSPAVSLLACGGCRRRDGVFGMGAERTPSPCAGRRQRQAINVIMFMNANQQFQVKSLSVVLR